MDLDIGMLKETFFIQSVRRLQMKTRNTQLFPVEDRFWLFLRLKS